MDSEGEFILSCAPNWDSVSLDIPWRDHWIQGIYYFADEVDLNIHEEVNVIGYHDELSFWFDVNMSR